MPTLDDFASKTRKEEINPTQKYPVIWKTNKCPMGDCRGERTSHRWSAPFFTAFGQIAECYDCHKTWSLHKLDEDLWTNNKGHSEFVKKRLEELKKKAG